MYPDATADAVQTDPQVLRSRGAFMNWRRFIGPVLFSSAVIFASVISDDWSGNAYPYDTNRFIVDVILVISLSSGLVGFEELKRCGHLKVCRNLLVCVAAMWILSCIPIFARNRLHWNMIGWNFPDAYLFLPPYVLILATVPIALLFNRRQSRSGSLATADNAE
jgi:hypothetical protein